MSIRSLVSIIYLLCSFLFVYSCISTTKTEEKATKYSEEELRVLEKARKELEIGRNMAGRLLRLWGTVNLTQLTEYVNQVAAYTATYSPFVDRRFMVEILDTEQVNAFACPGGYILLTKGAVMNATSEAELAAVLSHEIAHVGKEHMLNKLASMNQDQEKKNSKPLPPSIAVRKRPDPKKSLAGDMLAKYIAGSVAGLNVLKAAKQGLSVILEKGLGAELEFEADKEGIQYLVAAGYYPYALVDFLCRIEVRRGSKKEDCFKSNTKISPKKKTILDKTHPSVPKRINAVMSQLAMLDANKIIGAKGRKRFKKKKSLLSRAN